MSKTRRAMGCLVAGVGQEGQRLDLGMLGDESGGAETVLDLSIRFDSRPHSVTRSEEVTSSSQRPSWRLASWQQVFWQRPSWRLASSQQVSS